MPASLTLKLHERIVPYRGDIVQVDGRERLGRIVIENINVIVLQLRADHIEAGEISADAEHGLRIAVGPPGKTTVKRTRP